MQAIVIGGGVMGLSSAYFLRTSGWAVTVLEKGDYTDNCSYGNAGYVCPSHFIPLATPGIIQQGLKWMANPSSPFYVEPRFNWPLIKWALTFSKSATAEKVAAAAVPLRDIALFSQQTYLDWKQEGIEMSYEAKGLLEYFQTAEKEAHAHHTAEQAHALGIRAEVLTAAQVRAMEPQTTLELKGALYFNDDAHIYPPKLMRSLREKLTAMGVQLLANEEATGFEKKGDKITAVKTATKQFAADAVVLAAGSWSRELAKAASLDIPLVGGRGYSITMENSSNKLNHPAVLMEGRVAITPMDGNKIRFGGTMEITATDQPPRLKRVEGIISAVKRYLPEFVIPMPTVDKLWYGFRPCSADGLPYIGRNPKYGNMVLATGHAMVGLSLGAGTGKLVAELLNGEKPSVDLNPYNPARFD